MCYRYTLQKLELIAALDGNLANAFPPHWQPRFNVALTNPMPVVVKAAQPELRELAFGFTVPARAPGERPLLIANARAETVLTRPAFREAAQTRRCLIPADGFYEWEIQGTRRLPHYFFLREHQPFFFAGLWQPANEHSQEGFAIVTTKANTLLQPIHERMPVMLGPNSGPAWLGDEPLEKPQFERFCRPLPAEMMGSHRVDPRMNNVRYQEADCLAPIRLCGNITRTNTPLGFGLIPQSICRDSAFALDERRAGPQNLGLVATPLKHDAKMVEQALGTVVSAILRRHHQTARLLLLGIANGGVIVAHRLAQRLRAEGLVCGTGTIDISFHRDDIGRQPIPKEFAPTIIPHDVNGAAVILVDDVLYTGRTVKAALDELFDHGRPDTVELAVLVDRGGRRLPLAADYCGVKLDAHDSQKVRVHLDPTQPMKDLISIEPISRPRPAS